MEDYPARECKELQNRDSKYKNYIDNLKLIGNHL